MADIKQIQVAGTTYDIKDATARQEIIDLSAQQLQNGCVIYTLTNGTRNTFEGNTFVERVRHSNVKLEDVFKMHTAYANLDYAIINVPDGYVNTSIREHVDIEGYPVGVAVVDSVDNIGKTISYSSTIGQIGVGFAKGTALASARAAIVGKYINYESASPQVIDLPSVISANTAELVRLSSRTVITDDTIKYEWKPAIVNGEFGFLIEEVE